MANSVRDPSGDFHKTAKVSSENGPNSNDEENIWENILAEVQATSHKKLPGGKCLLVLGDNDSGKTTLIAKLEGVEDPRKGSGLEYQVLQVDDEDTDETATLGVYVLDGDPVHAHLLRYCLTAANFKDVTVVVTASLTQPWAILDSLEKWLDILETHITSLAIPPETMASYQDQLMCRFQEYVEPSAESPKRGVVTPSGEEERVILPLDETTLTRNLGLPVVVVVTKSDYMATLEKEYDYKEEHFDFIQSSIRHVGLTCGAALFYCSVKENKNCDLLYKYLSHVVYGLPFSMPALVVEKDAVFVPSGWDSDKKIAILHENMVGMRPDDPYADVIARPPTRRATQRELEITAEDLQSFLGRLQAALNAQPSTPRPADSAGVMRTTPGGMKASRVTPSPQIPGSPKKGAVADKMGTPNSEGVLANFFNSLLQNKKTGAGSSSTPLSRTESGGSDSESGDTPRTTRASKDLRGATTGSTNT